MMSEWNIRVLYLIVTDLYGFRQSYQCDTIKALAKLAFDFIHSGLRVVLRSDEA